MGRQLRRVEQAPGRVECPRAADDGRVLEGQALGCRNSCARTEPTATATVFADRRVQQGGRS